MQHPSAPEHGSNNPAKSLGLGSQPVMLTLPAFQQLAGESGGHRSSKYSHLLLYKIPASAPGYVCLVAQVRRNSQLRRR